MWRLDWHLACKRFPWHRSTVRRCHCRAVFVVARRFGRALGLCHVAKGLDRRMLFAKLSRFISVQNTQRMAMDEEMKSGHIQYKIKIAAYPRVGRKNSDMTNNAPNTYD